MALRKFPVRSRKRNPESYHSLKQEMHVIKKDSKEAAKLFKKELMNFFSFTGDAILKFYIVFVLILLPILLTKFIDPFFFNE